MATTQQKDYYKILGVKKDASADEIRRAFRKLARKHHPDVNPGDKKAEERFKEFSEANDVLSDPKKRKIYDQLGFYSDNITPEQAEAYSRGGGGFSGFPGGFDPRSASQGGQGAPFDFGGFDFSDFQTGAGGRTSTGGGGSFRDIFSGIFGGGSGGGAARRHEPAAGTDLEYQVNVPFWTAIRGGNLRLNIQRQDTCAVCGGLGAMKSKSGDNTCPECGGSGQVTQRAGNMSFRIQCPRCDGTGKVGERCTTCGGDGVVTRTESIEVRIKPGTRDGQRIRLAGKGNAGAFGAPAGDLFIIVRMGDHPVFRREGDDIHVTVPVTAMEAALGAKIEVPTIDGRAQMKIPPGTQGGQKLRLREKGVPSATNENARGDEIVEVRITVPEARDLRVRELWQELQKLSPEDPRAELWGKV